MELIQGGEEREVKKDNEGNMEKVCDLALVVHRREERV